MTTEEILSINEILAGRSSWDDFFRPHEWALHEYLGENNKQKNAHDKLISIAEVLFAKWYTKEILGGSSKKAESIKSKDVAKTLKRLLIPALFYIDDISSPDFKEDFSDILQRIVKQECKLYGFSDEVILVLYKLKEKDSFFYITFTSDEHYLLDRAKEQSLFYDIQNNDRAAISQLKDFNWLGTDRSHSLKTKFSEKVIEGIRGVLHQSVVDQARLINNSNFINEVESYALNYVVKQLQESGDLYSSLLTFILSFTYKIKYVKSLRKQIPMGGVPLYLQRRETQILYGYNYNLKEGKNIHEPLSEGQTLSTTIPDPELRVDEYYTTDREIVNKSFNSLSLDCRQKILYVNDAWLSLNYLAKDDDFMSFVDKTFEEKDREDWPRNDKDKKNLKSLKQRFDIAQFKRQCLKCYQSFIKELTSATGNKILAELKK